MTPLSISLPFASKALLFDLDDTLYDRDQAYYTWAQVFVQTYFSESDDVQAQEMIDVLVFLDEHEDTPRDQLFTQFLQRYPTPTLSVPTLVDAYYQEFPRYIALSQETRELLQALQGAGVPFGIITNGSSRQLRKLDILGLHALTSCIFVSSIFGCEKPDAAIFLAAAMHLQVPPDKILFIGDNPYNDIWGAHRVGMRTAWLRRGRPWPATLSPHIADRTIQSLQEILTAE